MAFGDCPDDAALNKAWEIFCERLKSAGDLAFKDFNPPLPQHRADAFRFLTQNLGQAFDLALETKNTRYPALHKFCTPYCKLGGDAADFTYTQAWIDGHSAYRIVGNTGTARFFNITVQGARPEKMPGTDYRSLHEPFGDIPEANIFRHEMDIASDGAFELFIGGERRGQNWLPTTPETRKLFIRQGFDRWDETPARMHIERIDMDTPRPVPTSADFITAIDWAGDFMLGLMRDWPDHTNGLTGRHLPGKLNTFPGGPEEEGGDTSARRGRAVAAMSWRLEPDQAMIVSFPAHDNFWMLTNSGPFFSSMDYLYRQVSYTPSRTAVDADGLVRFVMSHDDPHYHNWIDTQGYREGFLTYRNLLTDEGTVISTEVIKRSDVDSLMSKSAHIGPEGRATQLRERFNGVCLRYA